MCVCLLKISFKCETSASLQRSRAYSLTFHAPLLTFIDAEPPFQPSVVLAIDMANGSNTIKLRKDTELKR
eukprot:scaffold4204_cov140-Isochrysis_galbana.AAC.3